MPVDWQNTGAIEPEYRGPDMRSRGLSIVVVLALFALAPLQSHADDLKIIPGDRIGDVNLGMTIDAIRKLLGTASERRSNLE